MMISCFSSLVLICSKRRRLCFRFLVLIFFLQIAERRKVLSSIQTLIDNKKESVDDSQLGNLASNLNGVFMSRETDSIALPSLLPNATEEIYITQDDQLNKPEIQYNEITDEQIVDSEETNADRPLAGSNVMNVVLVAAECAPWSKTGNYFSVSIFTVAINPSSFQRY